MRMHAWVTSPYLALFGSHLPFSRCCGRPCGRVGGAGWWCLMIFNSSPKSAFFYIHYSFCFPKGVVIFPVLVILKKHGPTIVCESTPLQTFANKESTPLHCSKIRDDSVSLLLSDLLLKFFDWCLIVFYKFYMERLMLKTGTNVCIFTYFSYQFFPSFQAQVLPWPVRFPFFPKDLDPADFDILLLLNIDTPDEDWTQETWVKQFKVALGYGELESNSKWWYTYIYIFINSTYTPPRMQVWQRKV